MSNLNYVLNRTGLEVDNLLSNAESHVNSTDIHVTQEDKSKLNSIEPGAEVNEQSDWNQNDNTADDFIKNRTHYTDTDGTVYKLEDKYLPDNIAKIPSDEQTIIALKELELRDPVTSNIGEIYTDADNKIYTL